MNRSKYFRCLVTVALLIFSFSFLRAENPLILQQRQWADSVYAHPERMDELTLISHATSILAANLQEESAMKVLDVLSEKVPALETYVEMRRTAALDTGYIKTMTAQRTLSDYANSNFPKTLEALMSRYQYALSSLTVCSDNVPLEDYIKDLKEWCRKSDNRDMKAILCMARLRLINNATFTDPTRYPEIFEIEKEAQTLYPWSSDEESLLRAELYFTLGLTKQIYDYDILAAIEHKLAGRVPGMKYVLCGERAIYPSNAIDYLDRVVSMSTRVLNPGHPWVMNAVETEFNFRYALFNVADAEIIEREIADYTKQYFPENTVDHAVCRINSSANNRNRGLPDIDGFYVDRAFEVLKTLLGEESAMYGNNMAFQVMTESRYGTPENAQACLDNFMDYYFRYRDGRFGQEITFVMSQLMVNLYNDYGPEMMETINELKDSYIAGHEPTNVDFAFARLMYNFYFYTLSDVNTASQINSIVIGDLEKLAKKDKSYLPWLWDYKLARAVFEGNLNRNEVNSIFSKFSDELNKQQFPQKKYFEYLYKIHWADMKVYVNDYKSAYAMMREGMDYVMDETDKWIEDLGYLTNFSKYVSVDKNDLDRHVNLALTTVDDIVRNEQYGEINFNSLDMIIEYLRFESRFEDALRLCKNQIKIYENRYLSNETLDYYNLQYTLAGIYEDLNNLNEANRIYSRIELNLDQLYNDNPTISLLDMLWRDYDKLKSTSNELTWEKSNKLNKILSLTNKLSAMNANDKSFLFTHGVRVLSEYLKLLSDAYIPKVIASEDYIKALELNNLNPDAYEARMDEIFDMSETIREMFKDYDQYYKNNAHYLQLVDALSYYYDKVKNDTAKSLELKKELLVPEMGNYHNFTFSESIAWIYLTKYDYANAEKYLNLALEYAGDLKEFSTLDQLNIGALQFEIEVEKGLYDEALDHARQMYEVQKGVLDNNFQLMTTAEQSSYQNRMGDPANYLLRLTEQLPETISGEVYDAVVYRTGMQLRSQRETRLALERSDDSHVKALLDSVTVLKTRLDGMDVTTNYNSPEEYNAHQELRTVLSKQINRLERELLDATAHLRNNNLTDVKWQQIRDRLKPGEAAMEYIFSQNYVMSLIVTPGCERPQAVKLCEGARLWNVLRPEGINNSAALAKHLYRLDDDTLYKLLWEPNMAHLDGIERVYVTLPGPLSTVALNAIATPDGRTLFDCYDIVQLTTTGQLVIDHEYTAPQSITMMGDILYSPTQTPISAEEAAKRGSDENDFYVFDVADVADSRQTLLEGEDMDDDDDTRAVKYTFFKFLPYTGKEMDEIAALFPEASMQSERRLGATEQRLRDMIEKHPDILHLATHGFYITAGDKVERHPYFRKHGTGSMQRSGFALAGAELTWKGRSEAPDDNDGIVTADEVSAFDLKKTGLVVLSACETALGDTSFEGVFGLQRGFKQAGVQSLLVSLWSVSDRSTAMFMTEFYQRLLDGNNRQESWRYAVEKVRENYPQPYYWAPFIMLDGI